MQGRWKKLPEGTVDEIASEEEYMKEVKERKNKLKHNVKMDCINPLIEVHQ